MQEKEILEMRLKGLIKEYNGLIEQFQKQPNSDILDSAKIFLNSIKIVEGFNGSQSSTGLMDQILSVIREQTDEQPNMTAIRLLKNMTDIKETMIKIGMTYLDNRRICQELCDSCTKELTTNSDWNKIYNKFISNIIILAKCWNKYVVR